MKNHELLDLIGEAGEDYVLAAGNNVTRPRFRWKTLAACAACAALVLAAYPVYRAFNPPLHSYTVMEGGALSTEGDIKAPAGEKIDVPGQGAPEPNPGQPPRGDGPSDVQGGAYIGDAPAQEAAAVQYQGLLQGLGGQGGYEPEIYPDWFAGAWIDNSYYPEAKLAVAIVDGFRTDELEAQIEEWCGGEVVFKDAKYSRVHLYALQDLVVEAITGGANTLSCGIGVDVMENCLGVDIYGESVPDAVLAKLARLDPAGDAIRVRVKTGKAVNTDIVKAPAPVPGGATEPVFDGARAEPNEEPAPTPIADIEWSMPAGEPGKVEELPQPKAAAEPAERLPDIIEGADE